MGKTCINPECRKDIAEDSIFCGHCRTKQDHPIHEVLFFYGDDYEIVRQFDPVITPTKERVDFQNLLTTFQENVKLKNYPFSVECKEQRWRTEGGKGKPRIVIQPIHEAKWAKIIMPISVEQLGTDTMVKLSILRKNEMAEFYYATLGAVGSFASDNTCTERCTKDIEVKVGCIYRGKVKRIVEFGAFVEILPGLEGLVHISQLDVSRVSNIHSLLNLGDMVSVKVLEIDTHGKIRLSRKEALDGEDAQDFPEEIKPNYSKLTTEEMNLYTAS